MLWFYIRHLPKDINFPRHVYFSVFCRKLTKSFTQVFSYITGCSHRYCRSHIHSASACCLCSGPRHRFLSTSLAMSAPARQWGENPLLCPPPLLHPLPLPPGLCGSIVLKQVNWPITLLFILMFWLVWKHFDQHCFHLSVSFVPALVTWGKIIDAGCGRPLYS